MKRKLRILLIVLAGLLVLNGIGSWAARQGTFLDGRFLTRHVFAIDPENVSRIVFRKGDTWEENPVEGGRAAGVDPAAERPEDDLLPSRSITAPGRLEQGNRSL